MFRDTRRRLALGYASVTAVLLLLFAASIYLYVRTTLIDRIDDTLKHVIEVVERSLIVERVPTFEQGHAGIATGSALTIDLDSSFRLGAATRRVDEDRIDLEWFSPDGELLWSTWGAPLDIPLDVSRSGRTIYTRTELDNTPQPLRQIAKLVKRDRQILGYLRVSHPWFEVTQPSQDFIIDLSFGILGIAITVGSIGWWLSGIAMQPVWESYERLKRFTADASHELRSPIASIQTNVQVALGETNPETLRDRLQGVERTTRRLSRLVDDLLFLARQDNQEAENPPTELIPLDALLLEVLEEQQAIAIEQNLILNFEIQDSVLFSSRSPHQAPHQLPNQATHQLPSSEPVTKLRSAAISTPITIPITIPITTSTRQNNRDQPARPQPELTPDLAHASIAPDEPYTVQGDWQALTRLLTNLVCNSIRYTPAGGTITVTLGDRWGDRRDEPSYQAIVTIQDTGIGIAAVDLPYIFERFYRVDQSRQRSADLEQVQGGSGLGLSIVQAIAEQHQIQIDIQSQPQIGTVVTLFFPTITLDRVNPHPQTTVS